MLTGRSIRGISVWRHNPPISPAARPNRHAARSPHVDSWRADEPDGGAAIRPGLAPSHGRPPTEPRSTPADLCHEHVARAVHGLDDFRVLRVGFQPFADAGDA